jgi:integrase
MTRTGARSSSPGPTTESEGERMGKRRGNNEGSMYQRPNGRWCAQISIAGKRLTKYAATQRECREWLKETLTQVDDGLTMAGARVTLSTYFTRWLETASLSLRPNTAGQYAHITRKYILPTLGQIKLKDLRPDHIQQLHTDLLAAGTGVRTVQLVHAVLHRALGQALKLRLLQRNPTDAVDKPKAKHAEMKTLNLEQARTLLAAAQGERLEVLYYLAIHTGLRQGELLGLRWSDLDWQTGALQVQRQLQRVAGAGRSFVEPKTAAGRRQVILGPAAVAKVREHRKRQAEGRLFVGGRWQEQGLIFTTMIGTPLEPQALDRGFKKLLTKAGLPDMRFHDLRHTAATLMLQQGVHPKVVQERLGHSKISMTLDTYSHVLPGMQQDAAERLDAALSEHRSSIAAELQ